MSELQDPTVVSEIGEYFSKQGLTLRTESAIGIHSTFYVKDVGDKYFVTLTQQKGSSASDPGALALVEVKKQISVLANSADNIGAGDLFDVKALFGACTDEVLAAIRYISNRPLQQTTKSLFFAVILADLTRENLDSIASDLEKIIHQVQSQ